MAGIEENEAVWTKGWDWSAQGDEWSSWWGGTDAMWFGAVLPRIHAFQPAGTILEIAPGYGRWTQYLKDRCRHLIVVDLAPNCIEHCRQRFAGSSNIEYHVNDGRSLDMVDDGSIDLAFSFDSLVHAETAVLEAYIAQLARKLGPHGVGFIHHSNLGQYRLAQAVARRAPRTLLPGLVRRGVLVDLAAWRTADVAADTVASMCERAGLVCIGQEKISWEAGRYLIDAISMFTPAGSRWERPVRLTSTPSFRAEARRMAQLYAASSFE